MLTSFFLYISKINFVPVNFPVYYTVRISFLFLLC